MLPVSIYPPPCRQVRAAKEDQPGGLGQALLPDGPQRGQVNINTISTQYLHNIYTISTYYLHIIYSLPTQYLHRFARDEESLKMFKLISDFFLEELRLDWVTKAEIDHMVGRSSIPTLYLRNIYSISTQYLLNIYTGGGAAHQRLRERARGLLRPRRVTC